MAQFKYYTLSLFEDIIKINLSSLSPILDIIIFFFFQFRIIISLFHFIDYHSYTSHFFSFIFLLQFHLIPLSEIHFFLHSLKRKSVSIENNRFIIFFRNIAILFILKLRTALLSILLNVASFSIDTHAHTYTYARARTYTYIRRTYRARTTHAHTYIHTHARVPREKLQLYQELNGRKNDARLKKYRRIMDAAFAIPYLSE